MQQSEQKCLTELILVFFLYISSIIHLTIIMFFLYLTCARQHALSYTVAMEKQDIVCCAQGHYTVMGKIEGFIW